MQEYIDSVRRFHLKHNFDVDKDLKDCKVDEASSTFLINTAALLKGISDNIENIMSLGCDPRLPRAHLMIEELSETLKALGEMNEIDAFDGVSDLIYVTIGTAVAFDWPLSEGVREVCNSNMTKDVRVPHDVRLRDKGTGYVPPNLAYVLNEYRKAKHSRR